MEQPEVNSDVLLIEPRVTADGFLADLGVAPWAGASVDDPDADRHPVQGPSVARPHPGGDPRSDADPDAVPLLQAPGLAILAAATILEGYRWLGIVPAGGSHLSALVFGRAGAAVFAVVATGAAIALTAPGHGRRTAPDWGVIVTALLVVGATIGLLGTSGSPTRSVVGAADLLLAAAAAAALVTDEHRKRQAERLRGLQAPVSDNSGPTLPIV